MKIKLTLACTLAFGSFQSIHATPVPTQLAQTFVSGTGSDTNDCSRATPCKTFSAALALTLDGGEIDALDAGDYGSVTITKAVTINGNGHHAAIVTGAPITVTVSGSPRIVLRDLTLVSVGNNNSAVYVSRTGTPEIVMDDCIMAGGSINLYASPATVTVHNTVDVGFSQYTADTNGNESYGIFVEGSALTVDDSILVNNMYGFYSASPTFTTIRNTVFLGNQIAAFANGNGLLQSNLFTGNATVLGGNYGSLNTFANNAIEGNGVAFHPGNADTLRISSNVYVDNKTGLACGGTVLTDGKNLKGNNVGGSLAVCNPSSSIAIQ